MEGAGKKGGGKESGLVGEHVWESQFSKAQTEEDHGILSLGL